MGTERDSTSCKPATTNHMRHVKSFVHLPFVGRGGMPLKQRPTNAETARRFNPSKNSGDRSASSLGPISFFYASQTAPKSVRMPTLLAFHRVPPPPNYHKQSRCSKDLHNLYFCLGWGWCRVTLHFRNENTWSENKTLKNKKSGPFPGPRCNVVQRMVGQDPQ